MVLKERLAQQTGWSLASLVLSTGFGIVSFFLLSRILPREQIAIMGISSGFLAMLAPLIISPEVVIFRDYAAFKEKRDLYATTILAFWAMRSIAIMLIVLIAGWVLFGQKDPFVYLYIIGAGIAFNLNLLQAMLHEFFFVELKQEQVFRMNILYYAAFLLSLILVYLERELVVYLAIWVTLTALFSLAWVIKFFQTFKFKLVKDVSAVRSTITHLFSKVVIWNHLIASSMNLIYRADVFFLGLFVAAFTTGNYTIALMFSSLFSFVPQILQKMGLVGLTRSVQRSEDLQLVNAIVKYTAVISGAQLLGYILLGRFALFLVAPTNFEDIYALGLPIVVGVTLFNLTRPLHSYCFARGDLKPYFFQAFLPAGIVGVILYYATASIGGAPMTALSNIAVYGFLSFLVFIYAVRKLKYRFTFTLITPAESDLLKKIIRQVTNMTSRVWSR